VIDPVTAYLGQCNDHSNKDLRSLLSPLKTMAESLGLAVVLVTHHSKRTAGTSNAQYRVLGSIAYVGACRANFLFMKDPDDPTGGRRLMLDNGGNLAPKQPGLVYTIEDIGEGPVCDWQRGTVDLDADAGLARAVKVEKAAKAEEAVQGALRREAEQWLENYLSDGMKPAADCLRDGATAGFSRGTLHRVRIGLGVSTTRRRTGDGDSYHWSLSADSKQPPTSAPPSETPALPYLTSPGV
jgi:putative DNA primase/helicase